MPVAASLLVVLDPAHVRAAEIGQALLEREEHGLSTAHEEAAVVHLRLGLECAAQTGRAADADAIVGYLIETYGLLAVGSDPLLRPLLPPIPAVGATIRRRVLGIGGKALVSNGKLLSIGATLVPATPATP